jgi:hypothetical protein
MEKLNRIEQEWARALASENTGMAIEAIHEIRNSGSLTMLPYLFGLIRNETPREVRTEVLQLLSEIKKQEAARLIAASFAAHEYGEYLPAFVAACWQSGLDFSEHLDVFARLFIHSDYITALEAFTVLEESMPQASDKARIECIQYIRESEPVVDEIKLPLFRELRKILENLP